MTTDPRAALNALVAALERHLEAAAGRRGENDPVVVGAYRAVAEAFEDYDDALLDAFDEVTPLEVYRGDEDEDDDEFDEPDDVEGGGSYTGLDDEDYDEPRRHRAGSLHLISAHGRRLGRRPRRARPGSAAGSSTSSLVSVPRSCAAVRAPTIGATTPGRSRTQASAISAGEQPSPSAAVTTASTIAAGPVVQVALDERREVRRGGARVGRACRCGTCRSAPRGRAATRPAGRARARRPRARTSRSTPRASSEYSTWVATSGPGAAQLRQVAARAVCQPE